MDIAHTKVKCAVGRRINQVGKNIVFRDKYKVRDKKHNRWCEYEIIDVCDGLTLYSTWMMSCDDGASKGGTRTPTKKDIETMLAPYVRPSGMIATENDDEVHSWTFGIGPGPRPRGPVSADNRLSPFAPSYDPKTRYDVHGLPDD